MTGHWTTSLSAHAITYIQALFLLNCRRNTFQLCIEQKLDLCRRTKLAYYSIGADRGYSCKIHRPFCVTSSAGIIRRRWCKNVLTINFGSYGNTKLKFVNIKFPIRPNTRNYDRLCKHANFILTRLLCNKESVIINIIDLKL